MSMSTPDIGRLVESNQADDRRLIALVRDRPPLYARSHLPVASAHATAKALWDEVACEMGWTVAEVRRKWSHIRNSYSRHLRNEAGCARTGRGRAVSRWYLAQELEFLREHMATDTRFTSFAPFAATLLEFEAERDHKTEWVIESVGSAVSPAVGCSEADSRDGRDGRDGRGLRAPSEDSSSSAAMAFRADETSSYFAFFRGVHAEYSELSSGRRRAFKRQCLRALHALLDEQDRERASHSFQLEHDQPPLPEHEVILGHDNNHESNHEHAILPND